MGVMKKSIKILLIIIAPALLACLVVLVLRPGEPDGPNAASISDTARGPSFEVRVVVPRLARSGQSAVSRQRHHFTI